MPVNEFLKLLYLKQHDEMKALIKKDLTPTPLPPRRKGRPNGALLMEVQRSTEHDLITLPGLVSDRDPIKALRKAHLMEAWGAFHRATIEMNEGRTEEEFLRYFSIVERNLGAARALHDVELMNSKLAAFKAVRSHAKRTYSVKEKVLDYYHQNVNPKLSAHSAAPIVIKWYLKLTGEALPARATAKWISSEKKRTVAHQKT